MQFRHRSKRCSGDQLGRTTGAIAFPAISTGVYGFPLERAMRIAVGEVKRALEGGSSVERAVFCCFSAGDRAVYERILDELGDRQHIS